MAEISFDSPSSNLDHFRQVDEPLSLETLEDCLNFCSATSAPKNSANCLQGADPSVVGLVLADGSRTITQVDGVMQECFCRRGSSGDDSCTDPVHISHQEEHLRENELWFKITNNFGNVLPIDWCSTHARQLQEKSLDIKKTKTSQSSELDLSDDEELQQSFDLHSLIISSLNQEPMFTADEVISEIEDMLQDSPPATGDIPVDVDVFSAELLKFRERSRELGKSLEKRTTDLDGWTTRSLCELYDELDCTVREYSEVLIQQLALREELEYEKELMNQFISLHVSIQKKKRDLQADQKRGTTPAESNVSSLTTQIPFYPSSEPINTEMLEVYVKILEAIDSESPALPNVLTDYILKVVCPTN